MCKEISKWDNLLKTIVKKLFGLEGLTNYGKSQNIKINHSNIGVSFFHLSPQGWQIHPCCGTLVALL